MSLCGKHPGMVKFLDSVVTILDSGNGPGLIYSAYYHERVVQFIIDSAGGLPGSSH